MTKNKYDTIWKLLKFSAELKEDYDLWSAWCSCVASAIYLEDKYQVEVNQCSKQIYQNLDGLDKLLVDSDRTELLKWCSNTYDPYHNLRYGVETLDSIESVRVYLEDKKLHLHNLLRLKSKFKWIEM